MLGIEKIKLSPSIIKLVDKLRKIEFTKDMVNFINKSISKRFPEAKENNLTINEYINKLEDDTKQHTVVITSEISYFCIKSYLVFHANKFLSEKTNGLIKILNKDEYINRSDFVKFQSSSFDVVFEVDDVLIPLEIKVSQGNNGFTGATHSTSKVNDYLLISIDVNRDVLVTDDICFINSIFISITNIKEDLWKGESSINSSWTTYKFKVYDSEKNQIDYSDGIIFGSLKKNKVNYKIIKEKVY